MPLITLENVLYRYPKASDAALDMLSLEIPQGSFFALLGPNGAGKTTMLRLLCGRLGKYDGRIHIADGFCGRNGFLDLSKTGILLENPGTYPKLSIEEYVDYFAGFYPLPTGMTHAMVKERILGLSKMLELPSLTTRLSNLSLGNRQKVQILRAMAMRPKLLILDEPVANLDPLSREAVWKLIADWRKQDGGSALVCSHILAEMEDEATDFAIIGKGRVLKAGAVHSQDNGSDYCVHFDCPVSADLVMDALARAGIAPESVSVSHGGLSALYRDAIQP